MKTGFLQSLPDTFYFSVKGFFQTVLIGGALWAGVGIVSWLCPPLGLVVGLTILGTFAVQATGARMAAGEGWFDAFTSAVLLDFTGISGLQGAFSGYDPITGRAMTAEERGQMLGNTLGLWALFGAGFAGRNSIAPDSDEFSAFAKGTNDQTSNLPNITRAQSRQFKGDVLAVLDNGNDFSRALASDIRAGKVGFRLYRFVGENEGAFTWFDPWKKGSSVNISIQSEYAFQGTRGIYRGAVATVHEGQHYFDIISGFKYEGRSRITFELRAFLREAQFAQDIGRPSYSHFGYLRKTKGNAAALDWFRFTYDELFRATRP